MNKGEYCPRGMKDCKKKFYYTIGNNPKEEEKRNLNKSI